MSDNKKLYYKKYKVSTFIMFTHVKDILLAVTPEFNNTIKKFEKDILVLTDLYTGACASYNWARSGSNIDKCLKNIKTLNCTYYDKIIKYIKELEDKYGNVVKRNYLPKDTYIKVDYYNELGKKVTSKVVSTNKFKLYLKDEKIK